ncbi:MAG: cobyrinate a,c-diamide synthase [Arachnia sp.]
MIIPRLIVAAAASSAGKTTIATGLMGALRAAGAQVTGFKAGPDFIDPGFHSLATQRPGRNLDPVLTGPDLVAPLFAHGALSPAPADIAIVEGVMGLFDGQLGRDGFGSTAHIARLIEAPVVLVVNAGGSSRTAAAAALGLRAFDPALRIGGVIINRTASDRHASELAGVFEAAGMPVVGVVPRSQHIEVPSRHLGLVPTAERGESAATVAALAEHVARHVDLGAVEQIAASAPDLATTPWDPHRQVSPVPGPVRIGVFAGRAFTFRYAETTELLTAAGCDIIDIDPLTDTELPAGLSGLYIGGGFPQVHAGDLSDNAQLRAAVREAIGAGVPTVAECAGQLYLGQHLDANPMVGVLPMTSRMTPRLTLGYRSATAPADTLLATAGTRVTGHEFHRTLTQPGHGQAAAWAWAGRQEGFSGDPTGTGSPSLHTSYLHTHWAGAPHLAQRFADHAASFAAHSGSLPGRRPPEAVAVGGIDLRHHGDLDMHPGLIDLAVNVRRPGPPTWLAEIIHATTARLGSYPDPAQAREAIAAAHGVPAAMVLPTAGGAEAFTLIARTLDAKHPVVVHPQFTEPEAALRAAGHTVARWLLPVGTDAPVPALDDLPSWADAVFLGNPTNPTGWLHPRASVAALLAAGRRIVVDEAFMDATDEAESLIGPHMPDQLVLRSLSKTWGLAGLRVGYVIGDPAWIAQLAHAQPPWPLSSPAIAAMVATSTPEARAAAEADYRVMARCRAHLAAALCGAGFASVPSQAPFLLIDTSPCGPGSVREPLARAGFAVRRAETFPGLGPAWIRVKVPDPDIADSFVAALAALKGDRHL